MSGETDSFEIKRPSPVARSGSAPGRRRWRRWRRAESPRGWLHAHTNQSQPGLHIRASRRVSPTFLLHSCRAGASPSRRNTNTRAAAASEVARSRARMPRAHRAANGGLEAAAAGDRAGGRRSLTGQGRGVEGLADRASRTPARRLPDFGTLLLAQQRSAACSSRGETVATDDSADANRCAPRCRCSCRSHAEVDPRPTGCAESPARAVRLRCRHSALIRHC